MDTLNNSCFRRKKAWIYGIFSAKTTLNQCFLREEGIMLKIVYPICCGLDVHRDFVYACIATTENGITTYKSHRFSTFTKGLRELLSWLLQNNCCDVCMESTGKYWIPIYNILESDCKIVLAHPKYVKAIRGKKTDKKDAKETLI